MNQADSERVTWRVLAGVLFVALASAMKPASACSCAYTGVRVWPEANSEVPTNAHLWVFLRQEGSASAPPLELLRKNGRAIPTVPRMLRAGDVTVIELRPVAELATHTAYELHVRHEGQEWTHEIRTGVGPDLEAPSPWEHGVGARYIHNVGAGGMCMSGEPEILIVPSSSDGLYAIWARRDRGPIDFDEAPLTYVDASYPSLGYGSICLARNLDLTPGPLKLGVRLVDAAGNLSAPAELWFGDLPVNGRARNLRPDGVKADFVGLRDAVAEILAEASGPVATTPPGLATTIGPLQLGAGVELPQTAPGVGMRHTLVLAERFGKVLPGSIQLENVVVPEYPEAARPLGVGGTVVVEALFDGTGSPMEVRVRRSAHSFLDPVARDAVARWRTSTFVTTDPRAPAGFTSVVGFLSVAITFSPPPASAR